MHGPAGAAGPAAARRWGWPLVALVAALLLPSAAAAQEAAPAPGPPQPGPALDGLPGGFRVGHATPSPTPRLAVGGVGGYGLIDGLDGEGGDHHRAFGNLWIAGRPLPWLAAVLGVSGRVDVHPTDPSGEGDTSAAGLPYLGVRVGASVLPALSIGGDVRLEVPGGAAPSFDPTSGILSLRALASLHPEGTGVTVSLAAGLRLDGSDRTVSPAERFRRGDLVSLGVSSFDAVLLGVAVSAFVLDDGLEVLGEASWEPWFGDGAPGLDRAPLRVGAGARIWPIPTLGVSLGLEARLTDRTVAAQTAPFAAVYPRLEATVGMVFRPSFGEADADADADADEDTPDDVVDELDAPEVVVLEGRAQGAAGEPLAGVRVVVEQPPEGGAAVAETATGEDGTFRVEVPPGDGTLRLEAEGFESAELRIPRPEGEPIGVIALEPTVPMGFLRGLVRDFRGRPLSAEVRVADQSVETDEDGFFEIGLPAGTYQVRISAAGYRSQRSSVSIDVNGVTIFNADLRRERRRRR
jgi:hypothetical protein